MVTVLLPTRSGILEHVQSAVPSQVPVPPLEVDQTTSAKPDSLRAVPFTVTVGCSDDELVVAGEVI